MTGAGTIRTLAWFLTAASILPAQIEEVIEGERLFQASCAVCHGPEGNAVPGIDFAQGRFKRAANDEDIEQFLANGIPGTAMPPFDLKPRQVSWLIAYLRSMRVIAASPADGDAARGRALFEGQGGCTQCHRIDRNGSRVGPDLSEIGRVRGASSLEQSILEPGAAILPEHLYIRAVTRDGVTITGRRLNEDPNTVQIIDTRERLIGLNKADLREYKLVTTSVMPSYRGKLSNSEVADIVKYLSTRKGSRH
jgi:putative heme-binding domain-containing protein